MLKQSSFASLFTSFFYLFTAIFAWSGIDDLPDKHPLDESEYRKFVLDNKIKVILLSDPKLNKSSASISVSVGSLEDPEERQGLAHILEHMLFLGTEKYPDGNEYANYLRSNGGYSNAYTAEDHTNYHFQIGHAAFEGAVDRLAQFFISPLFAEEFTERELNAVHSEHQKNLENDFWRARQVIRNHYEEDHPANHFSTGDLNTLGDIEREEFINFYKEHYSANRLTLALVGKESLDTLEAWARKYFSPIVNQETQRTLYSENYLRPVEAFRLLQVEPLQDIRSLWFEFPLPSFRAKYESKPGEILSYILGYEGKGSLLSYLKEEGLATALGAYVYSKTYDYGSFSVGIDLTPKGLEEHTRVIELLFSYLNVLKQAEYPSYIFQERATLARLEELYANKGEGADRAVALANSLHNYPIEDAERASYIYRKEDADTYFELLEGIRPDNMLVTIRAKGVKTDSEDPYYKAKYSYSEKRGPIYQSFLNPAPVESLFIPEPNPYIPTEVKLEADTPVQLIDEDGLSLYYSQDTEFKRPKVSMFFRVRQPAAGVSLEREVIQELYVTCINEMMNEVAYTASVAGTSFAVSGSSGQITITVSGYDQSARKLLDFIVSRVSQLAISEERFAAIKERTTRDYDNYLKGDAWRLARAYNKEALYENAFLPPAKRGVIDAITLDDLREYGKSIYKKGKIEALVHGNMTGAEAVAAARHVLATLGLEAVEDSLLYERKTLQQKPGEHICLVNTVDSNNSALWRYVKMGADTPANIAKTLIVGNFISEPFYSELRTKQQLGYVVFARGERIENQMYLYYAVQSSNYAADEVQRRADAFIQSLPGLAAELSEEKFMQLKSGAHSSIAAKPKSIAEKAARLFRLGYDQDEEWSRYEDILKAIDELTYEEFVVSVQRIAQVEQCSVVSSLTFAREHAVPEEVTPSFEKVDTWKINRFFE